MEKQNKVDGSSRRKFIKIAAATAYVVPLIASMPAQATSYGSGSKQVVQPAPAPVKQAPKHRSGVKYNKYRKYRKW
ncbi:MAG: hypothetical protein COC05_02885 [Gammaproteobacteria bacterium]|nr:MAG: hypothetical protein COC05_02885 [Gammaproteobacteria bacterium]